MNAKDKIYDQGNFDDEELSCPRCGWKGTGQRALVAGFYGLSKFKQVSCPRCNEYLGNLSRDPSLNDDDSTAGSQRAPR